MRLALDKVDSLPFEKSSILRLTPAVIDEMVSPDWKIERHPDHCNSVPIDDKFLDLLWRVSEDLDVEMRLFEGGTSRDLVLRCPGCQRVICRIRSGAWHPNLIHWITSRRTRTQKQSGGVTMPRGGTR